MSSPTQQAAENINGSRDTRTQLLTAAWNLIEQRGIAQVTLAEIAAAAGVSRQAVYLHFGSRAGLLTEMVRHRDAGSSNVRRMIKAIQHPEPKVALEQFVRLWFRHVGDIFPVARAMEAAAPTDEAAQAALQDRMETLRQAIGKIIDRLVETGRLADRWTPQQATEWFWSRTHLDVWYHLAVDRGWDPDILADRTIQSLWTDLVSDGSAMETPAVRLRRGSG